MDRDVRRAFRALAELEQKLPRQYTPLADPTDEAFHGRHREKIRKQILRLADDLSDAQKQIVQLLLQLLD